MLCLFPGASQSTVCVWVTHQTAHSTSVLAGRQPVIRTVWSQPVILTAWSTPVCATYSRLGKPWPTWATARYATQDSGRQRASRTAALILRNTNMCRPCCCFVVFFFMHLCSTDQGVIAHPAFSVVKTKSTQQSAVLHPGLIILLVSRYFQSQHSMRQRTERHRRTARHEPDGPTKRKSSKSNQQVYLCCQSGPVQTWCYHPSWVIPSQVGSQLIFRCFSWLN